MPPKIMVFVGTVGSGKSTQIRLLASELRRRKHRVKVSSLKTGHIFAYFQVIILARMLANERKDVFPIRALIEKKPHIFRKIFRLWLFLDMISISIKFLFSIYLPLKLGYLVLVEEYIPATISDHIYLSKVLGYTFKPSSFTVTFSLRLMKLAGLMQIVFLEAEHSELRRRWKLRGTLEEKDDYLNMQRSTLLFLSKMLSSYQVLYIDTTDRSIKETHQLIVNNWENQ